MLVCLAIIALALSAAGDDPVEPRQRYKAEFEIRATGTCYPLDWFCVHVPVKYPHAELVFLNADSKPIRPTCWLPCGTSPAAARATGTW